MYPHPSPPSRSTPQSHSTEHKRKSTRLSPPCLGPPHPSSLSLPQPPLFSPATSQRPSLPLPYPLSQTLLLHLPQQLSVASDIFSLSLWLFLNNSCSRLTLRFVIFLCTLLLLHCFFILDIFRHCLSLCASASSLSSLHLTNSLKQNHQVFSHYVPINFVQHISTVILWGLCCLLVVPIFLWRMPLNCLFVISYISQNAFWQFSDSWSELVAYLFLILNKL